MPAVLNHFPVGFVTVHSYLHSAAAGGDFCVEGAVVQRSKKFLKGEDVIESGRLADVSSVEENMNTDALYAVSLCVSNHRFEVVDMGMDVAVRKETDEMECAAVPATCDKVLPSLSRKHFAGRDGLRNELCTLRKNLSRAERIVTDLGIAHIVVGGKSDSRSVGGELSHRVFFHKHVEGGGICVCNGVALLAVADADAVHNDCENGSLNAYRMRGFFEYVFHNGFLFS